MDIQYIWLLGDPFSGRFLVLDSYSDFKISRGFIWLNTSHFTQLLFLWVYITLMLEDRWLRTVRVHNTGQKNNMENPYFSTHPVIRTKTFCTQCLHQRISSSWCLTHWVSRRLCFHCLVRGLLGFSLMFLDCLRLSHYSQGRCGKIMINWDKSTFFKYECFVFLFIFLELRDKLVWTQAGCRTWIWSLEKQILDVQMVFHTGGASLKNLLPQCVYYSSAMPYNMWTFYSQIYDGELMCIVIIQF